VPAEKAAIGPINQIISRMYSIDSVLDGLSSFANDLKQMSAAIRKSDRNSLIIVDEFGKGTMTEVGLSLFASCLNYWTGKGTDCPHIFASSHFHALPKLLVQPEMVSLQTMDFRRKEGGDVEFLYKLVDGQSDNSFAHQTALIAGIPPEIVERANLV
jgi:DNA mismatch repair ATPase MutS